MARKILLADDSVTAQNMGRKILADAGYDVVTVNNGSAALKRIAELKPDLIVLDVYMPGYSGLEVCQRLKDSSETSHIPVLLTVGKLEPFKPEEARRVKADAHIVKPFEASELLTAITRLEDSVVPQQAESNTDLDTGWKSRLRFPSKKKKEEPEPEREDFVAAPTFRDFRRGKGQTEASEAFVVKAPSEPEPALVADIPRDITPEELDALSALAAKLDGPVSAENTAPLAEETAPVEAPAAEFAAAENKAEIAAAAAEEKSADEKKELESPAPSAVETVEPVAVAVEAPALAAEAFEAKTEVEIPVAHAELASEVAAVVSDPAAAVVATVNPAHFAEEPAPVDSDDEPIFSSAGSVVEPAKEDKAVERIEGAPAEELQAEQAAPPVPVAVIAQEPAPEPAAVEEPAPSDAELAEALRLLTPAIGHMDVSTMPSPGTLAATGQLLAEEAARNAAAAPRWMAEPVTLSPEEAELSLEAEMFRTFTVMPTAASGGEIETARITGMSAIAAAVENRLAEAGMAASAEGLAEPVAEHGSAEPGLAEQGLAEHGLAEQVSAEQVSAEDSSETTAAEASVAEAPAEVIAAVSNRAVPPVDGIDLEIEKEITPEKIEAEPGNSTAKVEEEVSAAATFADAVGRDEIEAAAEPNEEPAGEATAAVAEENQDLSSEAGGRESMSKDGKAKSGKANWHQIHTAPASTAVTGDVVEAAKQAEHVAEEAPKAMAAAAEGSSSTSVTDARTIASIVDSVMADLRPKIVEEIAKKLAGK